LSVKASSQENPSQKSNIERMHSVKTKKQAASQLSIKINGNLGPGVVIGEGSIQADNIAGGNITHQNNQANIFKQVYESLDEHIFESETAKNNVIKTVKDVEQIVATGKDEYSLEGHLDNLARMAPDILEVTLATLSNPFVGLSVAAKKIVDKIKEEADRKKQNQS
jgi:hypothetical protein